MAVHLISSNVSDLGKSDVGYLQFPCVQKDLTPMKTTADPAVVRIEFEVIRLTLARVPWGSRLV